MKHLVIVCLAAATLVACITPAPEPAPPPNYEQPASEAVPPQTSPPQAPPEPADQAHSDPSAAHAKDACGVHGPSCAEGTFCLFAEADQCGEGGTRGVCTPIREICNRMFAPVCGCDGKTYSNSCTAGAQGVSVRSKGECAGRETRASCGGIAGKRCPAGSSCVDDPNDSCDPKRGGRDCMGICEVKEKVCAPVRCKMFCKQGWQVGPDGCEICACAK